VRADLDLDRRSREMMHHPQPSRIRALAWSWPALAVAAALLWGYWPSLLSLERTWSGDPRYSHGYLIPLFSLYLLWLQRGRLAEVESRPSAGGLALIGLGIAMHLGGAVTNHEWFESASLLPSLAGLCVMVRGWAALRLVGPSIAFLIFMIPLPYGVENALGESLQRLATLASTVVLEMLGMPALQEGNTITLAHAKIGVVEACSGLSMLTFFVAISVGLILVVRRPWVERVLILAGAIPIALIANIARITATGLLIEKVGHGIAGIDFHDLTGYLMMPFALGLLWIENALIGRLFTDAETQDGRIPAPRPEGIAHSIDRPGDLRPSPAMSGHD
jgi:exosortase